MAELKFGTAGIRGIMGPGAGLMNTETIRLATMGLGKYLLASKKEPLVVVSRDSRNNSKEFAETTVKTLKAMGIKAMMFEDIMPVPVLSFAIRHLKADAGVMITASHNSMEYNGYKVYGPTGGQILEEAAEAIQESIKALDSLVTGDMAPDYVPEAVYSAYIEAQNAAVEELLGEAKKAAESADSGEIHCSACNPDPEALTIIYTPLNGSGRKPAMEVLCSDGNQVFMVPEQTDPDGDFTTCGQPNPELEKVYELALKYAAKNPADMIIATDPDADRVGSMVLANPEFAAGSTAHRPPAVLSYKLLSGNDLGVLVLDYLCSAGELKGKTMVSSFVSTPLADRMAKARGMEVIKTPVGFKYIGAQMDKLQDKFAFGFEESNGMLAGLYARDKDGVLGARLIARAAAALKKQGKTLAGRLEELNKEYGPVICKTVDVTIEPDAPKPETRTIDFEDGSRVVIRPSGTEPKIKYYFFAGSEERLAELMAEIGIRQG